jgi:hypothetical protein
MHLSNIEALPPSLQSRLVRAIGDADQMLSGGLTAWHSPNAPVGFSTVYVKPLYTVVYQKLPSEQSGLAILCTNVVDHGPREA